MRKKHNFPGLVFILLLVISYSCEETETALLDPAETDSWELFDKSNGLPVNEIWDIKLTGRGDIWLGTLGGGAVRYRGGSFKIFNTNNSDIHSDFVTCIEQDADGDLWFGTSDGISILLDDKDWIPYKDTVQMWVNAMKTTSDGWLWIGTNGNGFYIYDGYSITHIDLEVPEEQNYINDIEEDDQGRVWMATNLGLQIWDLANGKYEVLTTDDGLPDMEVWSLFYDSRGRMWIGTAGGMTVALYESGKIVNLNLFHGQASAFIKDIWEDKKEHVWMATWFDGVIRYDGVIMHSYKEYNGFPGNDVNAVEGDSEGNVWFGTYSSGAAKYVLPLDKIN